MHPIRSARCPFLGALALLAGSPLAGAQDAPPIAPAPATATATTTNSAQDLLKALQDAGVDLSALATANDDGTVTVKVPGPPPAVGGGAPPPGFAGGTPTAEAVGCSPSMAVALRSVYGEGRLEGPMRRIALKM